MRAISSVNAVGGCLCTWEGTLKWSEASSSEPNCSVRGRAGGPHDPTLAKATVQLSPQALVCLFRWANNHHVRPGRSGGICYLPLVGDRRDDSLVVAMMEPHPPPVHLLFIHIRTYAHRHGDEASACSRWSECLSPLEPISIPCNMLPKAYSTGRKAIGRTYAALHSTLAS
jgi:hypothetical protein